MAKSLLCVSLVLLYHFLDEKSRGRAGEGQGNDEQKNGGGIV
jgi:hypothetical protein